jgi:hypothetical protein
LYLVPRKEGYTGKMKVLVTYLSQTGNTRKIAEAIFHEIREEKEIKCLDEVESLEGYDLSFIGFPIFQFGPPGNARLFLEKHSPSRNIALFVTHASWKSPELKIILESWLEKCRVPAAKANLIGFYDCQGELSAEAAESFINSGIAQISMFGTLRPMTLGHPDPAEIENARTFAREVMNRMNVNPGE